MLPGAVRLTSPLAVPAEEKVARGASQVHRATRVGVHRAGGRDVQGHGAEKSGSP